MKIRESEVTEGVFSDGGKVGGEGEWGGLVIRLVVNWEELTEFKYCRKVARPTWACQPDETMSVVG